jgi:hypothetical protein
MRNVIKLSMFAFVISMVACIKCSQLNPVAGGSSSETVIGKIVAADGSPANNTQVTLLPDDYNPETDALLRKAFTDTTDSGGTYTIRVQDSGRYCLQAIQLSYRTRLLIPGIEVHGDTTYVDTGFLNVPGAIKIILPTGTDVVNGYVYIPGTTIVGLLRNSVGYAILDSVPEGTIPAVMYGVIGGSGAPESICDTLSVLPNDTAITTSAGWKFSRQIYLNTTPSGANVMGTVLNFPVLIRLSTPLFNFSQAKNNGDDIRFVKTDGTPCACEIERWDSASGMAEIWVNVDTVFGNDNTHYIKMLWGNANAAAISNSAAVFDTLNGFQGVWHLSEPDYAPAKDATGNRFDGTPSDTAPITTAGPIGYAKGFNGTSNFFDMHNTASGKLNFPENGTYTVSAWAYADTLDDKFHVVVGKSDNQYFLKLKQYYPPNPMRWEFAEYHDKSGWEITDTFATANEWKYLVGIRAGASQYFYLDGELVDVNIEIKSDTMARNTGDDVTIGKFLSYSRIDASYCPFKGMIDEVRISDVARSAAWIRLCYMNQKATDALVIFK